MHSKWMMLALCLMLALLPVSALAATYQATDAASLQTAIASAADGDTIEIIGTLTDIGSVAINKNLTLTGGAITGNSSFTVGAANDVSFTNMTFENIHNATNNLSAIYAPNLSGSLTVTGSTFADIDWDAIQATPVEGAQIAITGNTFRDDDPAVRQQRYVHIQSAPNTDFSATVTGNKMYGDLAQEALGVYYPTDEAKVDVDLNYIADTMTYPVCVLTDAGENQAQLAYPQVTEDGQVRTDQAVLGKDEFYATPYPSLEAAAAAGETNLVLIENTALNENISLPDGSVLDLNGKTLTTAPGVALPTNITVVENGGTVTPAQPQDSGLWGLLFLALLAAVVLWVLFAPRKE